MKTVKGLLVIFLLIGVLSLTSVMAVVPFGGNVHEENSSRAPADAPGNYSAIAGNVTELTITGYSTTQSWQGYYGNVSGTIQLADGGDHVMYNWSLASPEGEVYAANSSSVTWTNVQCFNFTSTTELNLTTLESNFNISSDDVDGVDETFDLTGAGTHDEFYTNNIKFTEGECQNTRIYDSTGAGENNNFEEALLYDPDGNILIFTSILDEEDVSGFDSANHDFEMLVLEDGHKTDTSTTTYYFYVELE